MTFKDAKVSNDEEVETVLKEVINDLNPENLNDVSFEYENGKATITELNQTVNLIVKSASQTEKHMYSTILPQLAQLQQESHILDPFQSYAKLYKSSENNNILVTEDVKENGFKKTMILDYDHIVMVVTELGKLHGVSLALRDQDPLKFEELLRGLENDFILKAVKAEESHKYIQEHLRGLLNNPMGKFQELQERTNNLNKSDKYAVIGQGDCSMKNLLFKYQKHQTSPSEMIFENWQTSRFGSPAFDLSYFLFTSTDKEFRHKHYEHMLQIYYGSVCTYLHLLGSNPVNILPYPVLREQLVKYSVYALYMIFYGNNDTIALTNGYDIKLKALNIKDILQDFLKFGYL